MKIVNRKGEEIGACCKFTYKGVQISASTVFSPPVNIEVKDLRNGCKDVIYDATSIEDAVEWINNNAYQVA